MMIFPVVTPMPIENSVRTYRISHHDTQQDLAAAVGVNEKTIRNIEVTGKCSLEIALRLSEYFNITVNELFKVADLNGGSYGK